MDYRAVTALMFRLAGVWIQGCGQLCRRVRSGGFGLYWAPRCAAHSVH